MIFLILISVFINVVFIYLFLKWRKLLLAKPKAQKNISTEKHSQKVGDFYNAQTNNFLKVYGDVIQAFRTKDVSVLLDHQIEAMQLSANKKVLDAGCGVCGPAIYFAAKTGVSIEAISISGLQVEKSKQNIQKNQLDELIHVQEGDYHTLTKYYEKNAFDLVYFLESFGHASDHLMVLDSVWDVLKPGGMVYIKDLFVKKSNIPLFEQGIHIEVQKINAAYHYNIPELNNILDYVRQKGFILSSLSTIDIPLENFENLSISNEFQVLTGINKIDNLKEYIFPVDFFELKLIKPSFDISSGTNRYFLQNMYYLQIQKWHESNL